MHSDIVFFCKFVCVYNLQERHWRQRCAILWYTMGVGGRVMDCRTWGHSGRACTEYALVFCLTETPQELLLDPLPFVRKKKKLVLHMVIHPLCYSPTLCWHFSWPEGNFKARLAEPKNNWSATPIPQRHCRTANDSARVAKLQLNFSLAERTWTKIPFRLTCITCDGTQFACCLWYSPIQRMHFLSLWTKLWEDSVTQTPLLLLGVLETETRNTKVHFFPRLVSILVLAQPFNSFGPKAFLHFFLGFVSPKSWTFCRNMHIVPIPACSFLRINVATLLQTHWTSVFQSLWSQ